MSIDELHEALAFYTSPTGQKFIEMLRQMATEQPAEFQQWLDETSRQIIQHLKEQCLANPNDPKSPCKLRAKD